MILKKPYALFIKIFKPIHIIISILTAYLIYRSNVVLQFFNQYIHSNENVVGQNIRENFFSSSLYIIPITIIVFCLIFMGIMFRKNKPVVFYAVNIFVYLAILVINIYNINFLTIMEESILSIKIVKLNHDLVLINMILEIVMFVLFVVRGLGLNFKKFNFDSDITKLNISDSDKEEIELNLNLDFEYAKRNRRKKIRHLKYIYKENKFIINCFLTFFLMIIFLGSIIIYKNLNDKNIEGIVYSMNKFNIKVNKSIFITHDFNGKKITDNYLVVIDASLQTNFKNVSLFLKDFSLEVGEATFFTQTRYNSSLIDIGNVYSQDVINADYNDYLFVFEIPEKYINSELLFVYTDEGTKKKITLDPKNYVSNKVADTVEITKTMNFNQTLGDLGFLISDFKIKDKFVLKYNYCLSNKECFASKEYIKPTINENFDKCVLRLNVNFTNETNLDISTFYEFFSKFGIIEYSIGEKNYVQNGKFEELISKKVDLKDDVYIGVNCNVINSDSIKLVFNIRESKYVYILK